MATQEKTWNVANRLHSLKDSDNPEVNHIIAGADEIYDDAKGAKQSDINAQTDAALADRYTKAETYSKEQLDSLITTPDVNYVTVATFADLPQTGEANTIYRVSSYDGTQVDASKYALYAWDGTSYQLLAVRSAVGEVLDVSEYNSGATYDSLALALAAVPASLQRGGMSIKFKKVIPAVYNVVRTDGVTEQPTGTELQSASSVTSGTYNAGGLTDFATLPTTSAVTYYFAVTETVDEQEVTTYTTWVITRAAAEVQKYEQYRLMNTSWSVNTGDWQGVDDEPTPGSDNLVKSRGVEYYSYSRAPIFDISRYNLTDGQPTHYIDFSHAVTIANIPSSYRRGGMMVRFILQSGSEPATTDKYVQYRFKLYHFGSTAFTNPDNWETVTDIVEQGSDNLPTSNAVYNAVYNAIIDKIGELVANGTAITSTSSTSYLINSSIIPEIPAGTTLKIKVSGIGINIREYRITLNNSIVDTDSELYSVVLSEPLTTLKVAVRSSRVLINGATVSAQVYTNGLVYEQAEQAEKIVNLQNRVLSLESDGSLMSAIEVYKVPNTQNQYSSFDLAFAPNAFPIIKRLSSRAKYTQNDTTDVPTIRFSYSNGTQTYNTIKSTLGYNGEFGEREMRIQLFPPETTTLVMKVNVPTGVTLYIDDFRICENITDKPNDVRINSHGVGAPFNTLLGFTYSAKLGCGCCIAVPKRTSDGVWCCYHDDANINTLRYENGQKVCSLVDGTYIRYDASGNQIGTGAMPISSINWTDLRTFVIFQFFWKNQRVPSVEEFFAVCMKTGMHPMFSIHPAYTSSEIQELYALAKQYHIIDKLNLKASVNDIIIEDFYAVFGDEVESYTFDASNTTKINTSITRLNALQTNAKKIIEISDTNEVTQSNINLILNAGFKAAAYIDIIESTEYVENLLKMGISEIATASMMSFGLNW